jgi:hypothetical protein
VSNETTPRRHYSGVNFGTLFVIAAILCFILAALEAFGTIKISGGAALGLVAAGLALWAAAGFAGP